jgi:CheY-like chemotaxis protein
MKKRILFVEDDATFRAVLERELRGFGYDVVDRTSAEEAVEYLADGKVDLALLDLRLPGKSGLELLSEIHALAPGCRWCSSPATARCPRPSRPCAPAPTTSS